ncbi:MAG: sugar phosphate isomerase/epimerase [Alphaproteobacteria bacterium]|nr:sugar phosphate isomerase/epimerase [Alphaproteobacteria bacterium]
MGPLSLAYLTVDGADPVGHVEAAAAAGFELAGLRITGPSQLRQRVPVIGNAALLRATKDALKRTGVRVLDAEVLTLAPEIEATAYAPFLETAAELGARLVQVVGEDPDPRRAADRLAALCDAAAAFRLRIAVEFMRFRATSSMADAQALLRRAGRANAGILVDALHLARSGGTPADVAALRPETVALMQLCDAPAASPPPGDLVTEAREGRLHPGDGDLPLDALLDALPPETPISVEVPDRSATGSAAERAKRAGDAARRFLDGYRARRWARSARRLV